MFRNVLKNKQSVYAQFRLGILPFAIETGRFKNIKESVTGKFRNTNVEERYCIICNSGAVEDEFHYLFECSVYQNERNILHRQPSPEFDNLFANDKFKFLMNNRWKETLEFVITSWNIRKKILYS